MIKILFVNSQSLHPLFLYISPKENTKNYEKCLSYQKSSLCSQVIRIFVLSCYALFPPVSHSWIYRNSLKINVCVEIYKNKFFNILRSKKGLILKLDDSIKYRTTKKFIEYFFYKKKLVPGLHSVLVNSPKYSQYKKLFCKWDILKEDYQQSSNPVLFYGHYKLNKSLFRMQNKFISFLSLVIHLLASFDALIQRCFRVIQKKEKENS